MINGTTAISQSRLCLIAKGNIVLSNTNGIHYVTPFSKLRRNNGREGTARTMRMHRIVFRGLVQVRTLPSLVKA